MGTVTAFWNAVNQEFSSTEFHGSRNYTNGQKAVAACVAERKKQPSNPKLDHNSITDSWTQVVDKFIRYEDEEKVQIEAAKAEYNRRLNQVYNSNPVRQNLVKNRRNKDAVDKEGYNTDSSPATEDRDDDEDRPSLLEDDDEWTSSLGPLDSASQSHSLPQRAASSYVSNTPAGQQNNRTRKHKNQTQMVRPNGRKRKRTDGQLNQAQAIDLILNAVNSLSKTGQEATSAEVSFLNERIRSLEMKLEAQSNKLETQTNNIMELKSVVGKLEGILMMSQGFKGSLRSDA